MESDRVDFLLRRINRDLTELRQHLAEDDGTSKVVRTGWRMVRGTHGVSYVEDPEGVDRLPLDMDPAMAAGATL